MDQPTANPKGETEWLTHTQQYNYGVCNVYLSAYRVVSWAARPHCSVHWFAYRVVHTSCASLTEYAGGWGLSFGHILTDGMSSLLWERSLTA